MPEPASPTTSSLHRAALASLPLHDTRDFADARRGFIGTIPDAEIKNDAGETIWSLSPYAFLDIEDAPPTVHPGLWRHARLNTIHGLFQVTDRIYQVRGFDISNITFVEGDTGLIVIDTLTSIETARAALALYYAHRPRVPVHTVIYTHSHADHFGGVKGIVSPADVASGKVALLAPDGFLAEATGENVLAGHAMSRRAAYQFGFLLPRGPHGTVDAGLGKAGFTGSISLIAPTDHITQPFETRVIDGVEIEFQLAPESEAPVEFHLYFPQFRACNIAENATRNLHNLLPLRGALVRDARAWSGYLNAALHRYGHRSDVIFAQHHWPAWGSDNVIGHLSRQRDLYKFIHDQTLRLASHGLTPPDIAETIALPDALEADWAAHGLYGTLKHNAKAVYQRYFGWYDGNPAHLDPLPPAARAEKLLSYIGRDKLLEKAREDFANGEYRWVIDILDTLIHAEPGNPEARRLAADAHEQLGYQSESATFRNAYLQAAAELRQGTPPGRDKSYGEDILNALAIGDLFDALAIRLDPKEAEGRHIRLNWHFTDTGEDYLLNLENATITHLRGHTDEKAHATVTLDRAAFTGLLTKRLSFPKALLLGKVKFTGNPLRLGEFFGLLETFPDTFPIVFPSSR